MSQPSPRAPLSYRAALPLMAAASLMVLSGCDLDLDRGLLCPIDSLPLGAERITSEAAHRSCYAYFPIQSDIPDSGYAAMAHGRCGDHGMGLATVDSAAELEAVVELLQDQPQPPFEVLVGLHREQPDNNMNLQLPEPFWLGCSAAPVELADAAGCPDDKTCCGIIEVNSTGLSLEQCNNPRPFLCEARCD